MIKNVRIWDGKLAVGLLEYQLFQNGVPVHINYRGEAGIEGDLLVIFEGRTYSNDYTIAPFATPDSTEFSNGFEHARKLKIKRCPKGKSDKWISGWEAGWKSKKG